MKTAQQVRNLCTLYIARHGETEWNVEKRIQGQTNSALTPRGEQQAQHLAKRLRGIPFDAAFSSDLLRAHRTAEIIALEHKLVVETTQALRERAFGDLEGQLWKDYEQEMRYFFGEYVDAQEKALLHNKIDHTMIKNVESSEQLVSRFITFIREISIAYAGKTVLVVCHGGIMMHFIQHIGYMKNPRIENTGYIKLLSDGVDFLVKELNGIDEWIQY